MIRGRVVAEEMNKAEPPAQFNAGVKGNLLMLWRLGFDPFNNAEDVHFRDLIFVNMPSNPWTIYAGWGWGLRPEIYPVSRWDNL
jgi:hypothetical protein